MCFTIFQNEKTPFQAIKTESLESRKNDIFRRGLTHGLGPKMAIFPNFFFQAIQARKISFRIFQNKKKPFQAVKKTSSKSRKIDIFLKGLTHCFGPKMAIFPDSFFQAIQARKMSFTIFQNKKKPVQAIKRKLKKLEKLTFSKGVNPWFWSKNGYFAKLLFLVNIGQENVIYNILERKKAFLGYRSRKFQRSKN